MMQLVQQEKGVPMQLPVTKFDNISDSLEHLITEFKYGQWKICPMGS